MRAFVIRPFGEKRGVNFERVDEELIAPALREVEVQGGTTGEIVEQGNIREDMFAQLVSADIVIADVSMHNANAFYELGIRHAVKRRATVLIRAKIDDIPFDLKTDRYLVYEVDNPAAALDSLVQVLQETIASERTDSPIFQLLPGYMVADQPRLLTVPRELVEDIENATGARRAGHLRLFAREVSGLRFEDPALRLIGEALRKIGDDDGARRVWERVRSAKPSDLQANRALSDVYRRLRDLVASDQAIARALEAPLSEHDRAELHALRGSNSKRRWREQWREQPSTMMRQRSALTSAHLDAAIDSYLSGFYQTLNHWYSGLNALVLTQLMISLAVAHPDVWSHRFENAEQADAALAEHRVRRAWLASAVRASLDAGRARESTGVKDPWREVSIADLRFLECGDTERVAVAYRYATTGLDVSQVGSLREQLQMFRDLGLHVEQATASLRVLPKRLGRRRAPHVVVFSGHMLDQPGRCPPRFPPDMEERAAQAVGSALEKIKDRANRQRTALIGVGGASNGGDILFHEACRRRSIATEVLLPIPENAYRATAASKQDARWMERFYDLLDGNRATILGRTDRLPGWLLARDGYSTWQRNNVWLLEHAFAVGDEVVLVALWDGNPGDGPGGVAHMVATAQAMGARIELLDTNQIFEDRPAPATGKAADLRV